MTLQGFVIGLVFAAIMFLVVWALGNVGLNKKKQAKKHS